MESAIQSVEALLVEHNHPPLPRHITIRSALKMLNFKLFQAEIHDQILRPDRPALPKKTNLSFPFFFVAKFKFQQEEWYGASIYEQIVFISAEGYSFCCTNILAVDVLHGSRLCIVSSSVSSIVSKSIKSESPSIQHSMNHFGQSDLSSWVNRQLWLISYIFWTATNSMFIIQRCFSLTQT